ncbi:UNVERIFIED_CONTAM: hypothetical protein HDU68_006725 [Siphonaria sp. JEL0065]|nr:hypothetical protein HDU68_006725 [Siphonaria sp. JEL0065]
MYYHAQHNKQLPAQPFPNTLTNPFTINSDAATAPALDPLCPKKIDPLDIVKDSLNSIYTLFKSSQAHLERLLYASVGVIFVPSAPPPHGGPRLTPGYTNYGGQTPKDLLEYVLSGSYEMYWYTRDKKILDFVASSINKVMAMQYRNMKDAMDERVLQGLRKAGHIEWHGAAVIPEYMAHANENPTGPHVVEFTPQRKQFMQDRNQGSTYGETPGNLVQRKRNHLRNLAREEFSHNRPNSNSGDSNSNSGSSNSGSGSGSGRNGGRSSGSGSASSGSGNWPGNGSGGGRRRGTDNSERNSQRKPQRQM